MAKYKHGAFLFFLIADIEFSFFKSPSPESSWEGVLPRTKVPIDSFSAHRIISIITWHVLGIITI